MEQRMLNHQNEPPGNVGVTVNGRKMTEAERKLLLEALGIVATRQGTIKAGETITIPWGELAKVIEGGDEIDRIFSFLIPEGRPGIDGHGRVEAVEAVGLPYGSTPDVVNVGTQEVARLRFYIPEGPPGARGLGVPPNPVEGYLVGFLNGVTRWVPPPAGGTGTNPGTGTGGNTTVNISGAESIQGQYAWEVGVVLPPADPEDPSLPVDPPPVVQPTQTIFDTATYAAYQAAIAGVTLGNKRVAAANSVVASMGSAQRLTMKRNGVVVLVAQYPQAMSQYTAGADVYAALGALGTVSQITAADITTGVWTMEISGGTNFERLIKLPVSTDANAAPGNGFNPGVVSLLIPRSMDGQ
jgi:hypothetical protein